MAGSRRRWLAATAAVVAMLMMPVSAAAHILSLVQSDPADGGTFCTSARRIIATFDGELDVRASVFTVARDGGAVAAEGRTDLDDVERGRMLTTLPDALPPGNYTVNWVAVSNDDKQETSGSFRFTAQDCLEIPWRAMALGSVALAALGGVVVVAMQWRQPPEEDDVESETPGPGGRQSADS